MKPHRPQIIILDDMEDIETVQDERNIEKLLDWYDHMSKIFTIATTYKADSMIPKRKPVKRKTTKKRK